MGNCTFVSENQEDVSTCISVQQFTFHYVIGRGGFGKVWKVEHKKQKQIYAMKEMSKSKIISKKSVNSVMNERNLLYQLKNPFIVNMQWAFQDKENLYLVMDMFNGGDLRYHIGKNRKFNEKQTKFFIACIVTGLEYLHTNGILHRDIKPENIIVDDNGYLHVTDLGIARFWKPENSSDTSGTPGYMAPEVMCRQNHGVAVDYFAVGVIAYECMMGRRPYLGRNRKDLRDQILSKQVQIKKNEIPNDWSLEAADFINKSIMRKPLARLGVDGPDQVKEHPWFKDFPWEKLQNKELESPFIPDPALDNFDQRQVNGKEKEKTDPDVIKQNQILLRRDSIQELFMGYNCDNTQQTTQIVTNQVQTTTPSKGNQQTNTTFI